MGADGRLGACGNRQGVRVARGCRLGTIDGAEIEFVAGQLDPDHRGRQFGDRLLFGLQRLSPGQQPIAWLGTDCYQLIDRADNVRAGDQSDR